MRPTLPLIAWRMATALAAPVIARRVTARMRAAGVAAARLEERRGRATLPRPAGRLVWFHAASVGESLSVLPLMARLVAQRGDLHCLITTGTPASAAILPDRLPERCLHQFAPLDSGAYLRRFMAHWRPDLLVCVESELWPGLLMAADRAQVPRALVNARLSAGSLRNWGRFARSARRLLAPFRLVTAQSETVATALARLGARDLRVTGDMKAAAPPPPADAALLADLRARIAGRPVWAAVSTHPGEEEAALAAHRAVCAVVPDALLILCPRHPDRADAIVTLAPMTRRSRGEAPEGAAVWLADTLGETGLWFRLAPVVFLGGSIADHGGHNPWEPAACGAAILHGAHVANAAAAHAALDTAGAATEVQVDTLGAAVTDLLRDPARVAAMGAAGQACVAAQRSTVAEVAHGLLALLPASR